MIKKSLITIGFFGFLLIPTRTLAAPSALCEALQSLDPVSTHYVQQVLDRAERGLEYARLEPANPDFELYLESWTRSIADSFTLLLDATERITNEEKSLTDQTACLRLDLTLIECSMNDVMTELNAQLERGSYSSIMILKDLLQFLDERYDHMVAGALDPSYADPTWGNRYSFDPPGDVWCCMSEGGQNSCTQRSSEECTQQKGYGYQTAGQCSTACRVAETIQHEDALCPYNADYGSPFQNGFGCDVEVMSGLTQFPSLSDERDALEDLQRNLQEFRGDTTDIEELKQALAAIYGKEYEQSDPLPERTHLQAYGCMVPVGYCSSDQTITCSTSRECAAADAGTCQQPDRVCSENRIRQCFSDSDCPGMGTCSETLIASPTTRSLRGPFSLDEDSLRVLTDFVGVRAAQEVSRGFSRDLQIATEMTEGEERDNRAYEESNFFFRGDRSAGRALRQSWSRLQAREEAGIFPQAADAQLQVASALTSLRTAVSTLSKLASEKDGLRTFLIRYAYYLRRTCMDRPCNAILDQILKVAFADECFPYTDGEFLDDKEAATPRWRTCADAADIQGL